MLTNLISFLYDINVDYLRKNEDGYVFFYNNSFYVFKNTTLKEENIIYLNEFINDRGLFHYLVKNRYNRFLSAFNNKYFVLMKVRFNGNRLLMLEDIYNNNNIFSYIKRENFGWINLWKNKIRQVEFYISNNFVGVFDLAIINYYLELCEIAIDYFNRNVKNNFFPITLCHKRIKSDSDLYNYYCITDSVFDSNIRDIAEYIKCDIYQDGEIDVSKYGILKKVFDKDLLISRLLFPSYFFDVIDEFIIDNRDFKEFSSYFVNIEIYERNLLKIIDFITK